MIVDQQIPSRPGDPVVVSPVDVETPGVVLERVVMNLVLAKETVEAAAIPAAVKPVRLKKVRRSIASPITPDKAFDRRGPFATALLTFVSIVFSL